MGHAGRPRVGRCGEVTHHFRRALLYQLLEYEGGGIGEREWLRTRLQANSMCRLAKKHRRSCTTLAQLA